jgi:hypothetical protein
VNGDGVVALVDDLMDRSRLGAALPGMRFVSSAADCAGAVAVVVDLARHGGEVAAIRSAAPGARIVVFGAHVDEAGLAQARADGADAALARSHFFRDPASAVVG